MLQTSRLCVNHWRGIHSTGRNTFKRRTRGREDHYRETNTERALHFNNCNLCMSFFCVVCMCVCVFCFSTMRHCCICLASVVVQSHTSERTHFWHTQSGPRVPFILFFNGPGAVTQWVCAPVKCVRTTAFPHMSLSISQGVFMVSLPKERLTKHTTLFVACVYAFYDV